jgi:PAS domain S-box-containing protein
VDGIDEAQSEEMDLLHSSPAETERRLREREEQYRSIFEATSDGLQILNMDGTIVEVNPAYCEMHGYSRDELIGRQVSELIAPEYRHLIPKDLRTIQQGGTTRNHTPSIRKDGKLFYAEARGSIVSYRGEPHVLVVVRDITERVQASELLEQRVADRTRELSTLLSISARVTSTLQLYPLLDLILDELKTVVDYVGAGITVFNDGMAQDVAYKGPVRHQLPGAPHPIEDFPLFRWVCRGEQVIMDDVRHDTSPPAVTYRSMTGDLINTTYSYVVSHLLLPMAVGDRVVACLILAHSDPGYYTAGRVALAQAVANQAAIAIDNAQLYERAQQVAVLEERQRLSRELHDSVSQALYSIVLGTKTARALLDRDPSRLADPLEFVLSQAERGLAEMRALIFELRPEALEQDGLVTALERQADLIRTRHMVAIELELCAEPDVPVPLKEALYRITQEALHNTVKHAQAQHVGLSLANEGNELTLVIRDDGAGFDASGEFPGHYGLRSMQERAAGLGGSTRIHSAPGAGTTVHVAVPYARQVSPAGR